MPTPKQTVTDTAATPAAKPAKKVIAPPPGSGGAGPMHKHTGFIIAIAICGSLLLIAAVLAFMAWSQRNTLRENLSTRTSDVAALVDENTDLQDQLTEQAEQLASYRHYYLTTSDPFIQPTELHAINPMTGADETLLTVDGWYELIGQQSYTTEPELLIHRIIEGDQPGYDLYTINPAQDTRLTAASVTGNLPQSREATLFSPDNEFIAAVYDNGVRGELVFWNAWTGEELNRYTLEDGQFLSSQQGELGGPYGIFGYWTSTSCASFTRLASRTLEDGQVIRANDGIHEYCINE